jgi:ATP adenylyltransferase
MFRLWSPWRLKYVTGAGSGNPKSSCIFCDGAGPSPDPARAELIVARGVRAFIVLNLYPYNSGHLLVAPNRHLGSLAAATEDELNEMMRLTRLSEIALTEAYHPEGINVGINLGRPAGAGIVDHVHIHLVPRWSGDTNFMSVFSETRVLPESIADTANRLRPIFDRLLAPRI